MVDACCCRFIEHEQAPESYMWIYRQCKKFRYITQNQKRKQREMTDQKKNQNSNNEMVNTHKENGNLHEKRFSPNQFN